MLGQDRMIDAWNHHGKAIVFEQCQVLALEVRNRLLAVITSSSVQSELALARQCAGSIEIARCPTGYGYAALSWDHEWRMIASIGGTDRS